MHKIITVFMSAVLGLAIAGPTLGQLPLRHQTQGQQLFQGYGSALAGIADRDGDGVADLLVGSPDVGRVEIISGSSGAALGTINAPMPYESFGHAVAGLGDLDGDGSAEIAVGAPGHDGNGANCGRVLVYSGATLAILLDLIGDYAGDELGTTLLRWNDLDGDGKDEFVAGAPGSLSPGYVRLFSGAGQVLGSFWGTTPAGGTGAALGLIPDLDGDGLDELALGSPWADFGGTTACGRVQVVAGSGSGLLLDLGGATTGAGFGSSVAGASDYDGDGLAEILVGAPGDDANGPDTGALFVVSGGSGINLRSHRGGQPFALFGNQVETVGDVDGDRVADYAVGAWFEDGAAVDSGAIRIFSGASGAQLLFLGNADYGAHFGREFAALGDVDGDGFADFAAGLPGSSAGTILGGAVRVLSLGGFRVYGQNAAGNGPTMSLTFEPGGAAAFAAGAPGTLGHLVIEGAAAWSAGLFAASLYPAAIDLGFLQVLVNPDPNLLIMQASYGHDAFGEARFLVDASQPFLAGVSLWLQAYDLSFPYGATNGLEMRCLP